MQTFEQCLDRLNRAIITSENRIEEVNFDFSHKTEIKSNLENVVQMYLNFRENFEDATNYNEMLENFSETENLAETIVKESENFVISAEIPENLVSVELKRISKFVSDAAKTATEIVTKLKYKLGLKLEKYSITLQKLKKYSFWTEFPENAKVISEKIDSELTRRNAKSEEIKSLFSNLLKNVSEEEIQRRNFISEIGGFFPSELFPEFSKPTFEISNFDLFSTYFVDTKTDFLLKNLNMKKKIRQKEEISRLQTEILSLKSALLKETTEKQCLELALKNLSSESKFLLSNANVETGEELKSAILRINEEQNRFLSDLLNAKMQLEETSDFRE